MAHLKGISWLKFLLQVFCRPKCFLWLENSYRVQGSKIFIWVLDLEGLKGSNGCTIRKENTLGFFWVGTAV